MIQTQGCTEAALRAVQQPPRRWLLGSSVIGCSTRVITASPFLMEESVLRAGIGGAAVMASPLIAAVIRGE